MMVVGFSAGKEGVIGGEGVVEEEERLECSGRGGGRSLH